MKLKAQSVPASKAPAKGARKPAVVPEERRIGRPVTVGDERINLFISPEDRVMVDTLIRRSQELRYKTKLTLSYIFREGARRLCAELNAQLDKAAKGALHVKRRSNLA